MLHFPLVARGPPWAWYRRSVAASSAVAVFLSLLLAGPLARAGTAEEGLGAARAAQRELEYPRALRLAQQALQAGDATPDQTWQLHALIGELAAANDLPDLAVESFIKALVLRPSLTLPLDVSPKVFEPFEVAKQKAAGVRLQAVVHSPRSKDGEVRTRVEVAGDLALLVSSGEVRVLRAGGEADAVPLARAGPLTARWQCPAAPCPHYVALRDVAGNELLWAGSPAAPLFTEGPPPAPVAEAWFKKPVPYLGAGAALAAASVYFGFTAQAQQAALKRVASDPGAHTLEEARALDASRRGNHALMWVSLGLTGAAGAAAIAVW